MARRWEHPSCQHHLFSLEEIEEEEPEIIKDWRSVVYDIYMLLEGINKQLIKSSGGDCESLRFALDRGSKEGNSRNFMVAGDETRCGWVVASQEHWSSITNKLSRRWNQLFVSPLNWLRSCAWESGKRIKGRKVFLRQQRVTDHRKKVKYLETCTERHWLKIILLPVPKILQK